MEATFNIPAIPTSERRYTCFIVLLDLKNVGVIVGISLLSCTDAELYVIVHVFPVMAAILNLLVTVWSESVHTSLNVLLDPDNVGQPLGSCCYHVHKLRCAL